MAVELLDDVEKEFGGKDRALVFNLARSCCEVRGPRDVGYAKRTVCMTF